MAKKKSYGMNIDVAGQGSAKYQNKEYNQGKGKKSRKSRSNGRDEE